MTLQSGFATTIWCPTVELRQYALHAGQRDTLISLFDEKLVETQEAVGLIVMGQFRDLDDDDSFVWLRGFNSMETRASSLSAFYDGPAWAANKDRANATMIDSDNVLLLKAARSTSGFNQVGRPDRDAARLRRYRGSNILATIYYLRRPAEESFLDFFESHVAPAIRAAGGSLDAYYVTDPTPNGFPRLPVREGEPALVWFSIFGNMARLRNYEQRAATTARELEKKMTELLQYPPEVHHLVPTSRSRLPAAIVLTEEEDS
jgi:hypothetical protein